MHRILIFMLQLSKGLNKVIIKQVQTAVSGCLKLQLLEHFVLNMKKRRHCEKSIVRSEMDTMETTDLR